MSAQDRRRTVLGVIKGRVTSASSVTDRAAAVASRLGGKREPHLVPDRARQDAGRLEALFMAQLRAANATVLEAASEADVPGVVASYLRSQNLPLEVRAGADGWLRGLNWSREPAIAIRGGRADPVDEVGLTHAVSAVAETGTLVLASGPDNPVTVTFLPETSIILVRAGDLVGPYEAAFDKVRERLGRGIMPRTLNLVSGPSRTADVGGRLVTGAHGPRRLCVVLVR